jgi:hypothetical protein
LTGGGLVLANIDNAHEPFGGDIRTQLFGSTIYALAHECHSGIAVELFVDCLMPQFFDAANALTDALRDHLAAETNLQPIFELAQKDGLRHFLEHAIV